MINKDLNTWKHAINIKYNVTKRDLKRIRQDSLYTNTQKLIDHYSMKGKHEFVRELNEYLYSTFNISDHHIRLQDLHNERIQWLKAYTDNKCVKDNETYRQIAYKCIHEDYAGEEVQQLITNKCITGLTKYC